MLPYPFLGCECYKALPDGVEHLLHAFVFTQPEFGGREVEDRKVLAGFRVQGLWGLQYTCKDNPNSACLVLEDVSDGLYDPFDEACVLSSHLSLAKQLTPESQG